MKIAEKSKLVMIGDSITDCDRVRPIAEGRDNLGRGYVQQIDALLGAVYPDLGIRVLNAGISGNTVRHLAERWERDVLEQTPDWVSVMIGINDVWRQFDIPRQVEQHVLPKEYEQTLEDLVARTRPTVKGMILATPYYIEPYRDDAMRRQMDRYGAIVKKIAEHHDAILIDTQAAFDDVLRYCHPNALAGDRVHPNQTGHMILARAFLNGIGFDWSRTAR